jgi:hypothetical protein
MCINQGYVPPTCKMDGQLCWLLVNDGKNPCDGCNYNRSDCKGRPKKEKYDSEFYRVAVCIDNHIERERQKQYEEYLRREREKDKRRQEHAKCNAKTIISIVTDIGRRGRPEIEVKVNDLINEIGYVKKYENPDEVICYIPAIIRRYGAGQIQCEIDGYGLGIYDRLKNAGLGIDIVPLHYIGLRL